jgi:hypothetical protein
MEIYSAGERKMEIYSAFLITRVGLSSNRNCEKIYSNVPS